MTPTKVSGLLFEASIFICFMTFTLAITTLSPKYNVLFIVLDDLRPVLGCYGAKQVKTPNIDQLASKSILFENAFAQQALCGPSRTSFLTGRRPDTTKLYDFKSYWRKAAGNFTTIPQHFKQSGYYTASFGKVFHPGKSSGGTDDYPYSWSVPPYHPSTQKFKNAKVCPGSDGKRHIYINCPVDISQQPGCTLPDIQTTVEVTRVLEQIAGRNNSKSSGSKHGQQAKQPYFLAVGYHKPHIPFKYPKDYLLSYPLDKTKLPRNHKFTEYLPKVAWETWSDLRKREDVQNLNLTFPFQPIPDLYAKELTRNYYASVTYVDALIGELLSRLQQLGMAKDTIVLLTSDHAKLGRFYLHCEKNFYKFGCYGGLPWKHGYYGNGWSLGEHQEWAKYSVFREATRVPLMVYIPGVTDSLSVYERRRQEIVELVDLFPTLADFCGLEIPGICPQVSSKVDFCTEGVSFAPLILKTEERQWKSMAFSQYPRPSLVPQANTDEPHLKDIKVMGYSMQNSTVRYSQWIKFDNKLFKGDWNTIYARELYVNQDESENVANIETYKAEVARLSSELQKGWREAMPQINSFKPGHYNKVDK